MASSSRVDSPPTSTQLWALGSDGAVYVLQDVGAWLSSVRSNEVLHTKMETLRDNWSAKTIEGKFERVQCGARGLVCAKRDGTLYVRRGVTYDNALGTAWAEALCDVSDFAVGSRCLVRRTSRDELFVTTEPLLDLSSTGSIFLPHWDSLPSCEHVESHQMFAMDARDNLFLVSPSSGKVHVCQNLSSVSPDKFKWKKLIEGPPAIKKPSTSSFLNIFGWGADKSSKTGVFKAVSSGDGCLWFVGGSGVEMFQLVLNYTRLSRKRKRRVSEREARRNRELFNIEASWKRFELPDKDDVTLLAADWTEIDVVCAAVQENRTVVSYAALQENSGRVVVPNPDGFNSRWKSISICAVPQQNPSKICITGSVAPENPYAPMYPKLPPPEDHDMCCDDGDCFYCSSAANETSYITSNNQWSGDRFSTSVEEQERENEGERLVAGVSPESSGEGGTIVTGISHRYEEPTSTKRSKADALFSEKSGSVSKGKSRKRRKEKAIDERYSSLIGLTKKSRVSKVDQLAGIPVKLHSQAHYDTLLRDQVYI